MADPRQRQQQLAGDFLQSGSGGGRRVPKWLVLTAEVLAAALVAGLAARWVIDVMDEERSAQEPLQIVGAPEVLSGSRSATVTVDLENVSGASVILDTATILESEDDPTHAGSGAWANAPSWVSAYLYPLDQALVTRYDSRLQPLDMPGHGGTAALVVIVEPPCQRSPSIGDVDVVVGWHTAGGALGQQTVAGVLQNGESQLSDLVAHLCATAWDKPSGPFVSSEDLVPGRTYDAAVKGLPVSFSVPGSGWERFGAAAMSKGTKGSGAADAVLFVTDVQGANGIRACGQWWGSPVGTLESWARRTAKSDRRAAVRPPEPVEVNGASGFRVVLRIGEVDQCRPGLHHTWRPVTMRAPWTGIESGDTVRIWLLEALGQVVYIEGDTHRDASPRLRHDVAEIVRSLEFG